MARGDQIALGDGIVLGDAQIGERAPQAQDHSLERLAAAHGLGRVGACEDDPFADQLVRDRRVAAAHELLQVAAHQRLRLVGRHRSSFA